MKKRKDRHTTKNTEKKRRERKERKKGAFVDIGREGKKKHA
jgi:hypothetical protein